MMVRVILDFGLTYVGSRRLSAKTRIFIFCSTGTWNLLLT